MSDQIWQRGVGVLWRIKGTLLVQIVIITIGLLTRHQTAAEHEQFLHRYGMDYQFLMEGKLWHLLTGTWIQSKPGGIALSMILLAFTGTVFFEWLAGTRAMLLTCITADWISTILTNFTLRGLSALGMVKATLLLTVPDSGTSALAHAGYGAAVMLLPRRWLKIALPVLIVFTLSQFVFVSLTAAIVHCWAALYGALIAWFVLRSTRSTEQNEEI